jgi:hypothetical protein
MAFIPTTHFKISLLDLIVERLRRLRMSDWLKLAIGVGGYAILTWQLVQQHEFRITKLESGFEQLIDKQNDQLGSIQKTLIQLQIEVGRARTPGG